MTKPTTPLEQTFLALVAIDEVHPHENEVLTYVKKRLEAAAVPYQQDKTGNIVARIAGGESPAVGIVGHVDIAAPLGGRQVVVEPGIIKTDGAGLLGADDKTAVAAMLELADAVKRGEVQPRRPIELIFTVGEEAGCVGAVALDLGLVMAKQVLVFDWLGRVNRLVTQSPAYLKVDVEYIGRTAHPAEWQQGINAGTALIAAAAQLKVGEYAPGVTGNIGIFEFGQARNQVPGRASLQAELRSFDTAKVEAAAAEVAQLFRQTAEKHGVEAQISLIKDSPAYRYNASGELFTAVTKALSAIKLQPVLESTFGCFDGNILASRGLDVIILGAGYYDPHSPGEYLDRAQFAQMYAFMLQLTLSP